jgi:hypothetical protein
MPTFSRVSHISFSVRDAEASAPVVLNIGDKRVVEYSRRRAQTSPY